MITIPSGEFTGIIADALPFAVKQENLPTLNCVRLEWDATQLHALATDLYRIAISSWHPDDDPPEGTIAEDDLFTEWGGADDPWSIVLCRDDAVHLVKVFKLPPAHQFVPLTVDVHDGRLTVQRSRDTGHSALRAVMDHQGVDTPDVRATLAKHSVCRRVGQIQYTPALLADFGKVRPRGPLHLTFTGADKPTLVSIGERFTGAIAPVRANTGGGPDTDATQSLLRDGAGLLVGPS